VGQTFHSCPSPVAQHRNIRTDATLLCKEIDWHPVAIIGADCFMTAAFYSLGFV
jgi:hypothetical protein